MEPVAQAYGLRLRRRGKELVWALEVGADVVYETVDVIGVTIEQVVLEQLPTDLLAMGPEVKLFERGGKDPALEESRDTVRCVERSGHVATAVSTDARRLGRHPSAHLHSVSLTISS